MAHHTRATALCDTPEDFTTMLQRDPFHVPSRAFLKRCPGARLGPGFFPRFPQSPGLIQDRRRDRASTAARARVVGTDEEHLTASSLAARLPCRVLRVAPRHQTALAQIADGRATGPRRHSLMVKGNGPGVLGASFFMLLLFRQPPDVYVLLHQECPGGSARPRSGSYVLTSPHRGCLAMASLRNPPAHRHTALHAPPAPL